MSPREFLNGVLDLLWTDYRKRVPYADRYCQLVTEHGGTIANDHIAYRSFNSPKLTAQVAGYAATERIFANLGYQRITEYDFPQMNLRAVHLDHPDGDLPRIFVSQLEVANLPAETQELINAAIGTPHSEWTATESELAKLSHIASLSDAEAQTLIKTVAGYFTRPWNPPLRSTVERVNETSQYGAWTLLHGNSVNHFTAYINEQHVAAWPDIEATIAGLKAAGVPMKDSIEGDPGTKLRQSATKAATGSFAVTEADGSAGKIDWTYAYYELAERGLEDGKLFMGFLGPQTPGLFEMTRKN
jgi:hypothetical protein